MTLPRKALVGTAALVMALAASGCGGDDRAEARSVQDEVKVVGDFGKRPEISFTAPLDLSETSQWDGRRGEGDRVASDATVILQLTLANGRTGKIAISTPDRGPLQLKLPDEIFPALARALAGQRADSRVVVASTPDDAYGSLGSPQIGIKGGDPVVMVADILSTDPTEVLDGPTGATLTPPATAPKVQESGGEVTGLDVTGLRKPRRLTVIPLREGDGPVVDPPDRITADYYGAVWGASSPFDSTYGRTPASFSIGLKSVIGAWDRALAGVKEGSRVMIICPPRTAYGATAKPGIPAGSTLVFVVDVLGVG